MNYCQNDVKQLNRKNVLTLIAEQKSISRRDICTLLGSSMTTVLKITDYLEARGLIIASGEEKTSRGRRPQILKFLPEKVTTLAIDYNGKEVDIALCDYYGNELSFDSFSASNDLVIFFQDSLPKLVKNFMKKNHVIRENLVGIGLSMPGNFNNDSSYRNLGPLSKFRNTSSFNKLFQEFGKAMQLPVYCFNDVNAAAYGEFLKRDKMLQNLVFILAGDGFGSGLILDSKLRVGEHFQAGEVGYLVYDSSFNTDAQKPGWFEAQLSREALEQRFPDFAEGIHSSELIDYVARLVSLSIANISNMLDISQFIFAGSLVKEFYSDGLFEKVNYYSSRLTLNSIDIDLPKCLHPSISGVASLVIAEGLDNIIKEE